MRFEGLEPFLWKFDTAGVLQPAAALGTWLNLYEGAAEGAVTGTLEDLFDCSAY
jgi:hypothetical protein